MDDDTRYRPLHIVHAFGWTQDRGIAMIYVLIVPLIAMGSIAIVQSNFETGLAQPAYFIAGLIAVGLGTIALALVQIRDEISKR